MSCTCGHEADEHKDTFLMPCAVDGCDCLSYDEDEDEDEDDE